MRFKGLIKSKRLIVVLLLGGIVTALIIAGQILKRSRSPKGQLSFPASALSEVVSSDSKVTFEDPGRLQVVNGFACGRHASDSGGNFVRLLGSQVLPPYATNATVFLNGWHLTYLGDDQHVRQLGTDITKIRLADNMLRWEASGGIADADEEEGYDWCYYYTVIAWNQVVIDGVADQTDDKGNFILFTSLQFGNEETALATLSSYIRNPAFASKKTVAILPRGFFFGWNNGGCLTSFDCKVDRHLLQIAYNLDHSETFIEQGKNYEFLPTPSPPTVASYAGAGFVSWETFCIFKNDEAKEDYYFGELVSALGGNNIGILQPPFAIRPIEETGSGCITTARGVTTKQYVIENIPFEQAVPMLTGWDLQSPCGDEHVKDIGIWLSDIEYIKPTGAPVGTLRYKLSSVFCDNDCDTGNFVRHKVSILGFQSTGTGVNQPMPDLVPVELPGGLNFCKQANPGQLAVRVTNQGTADAPASRTAVRFSSGEVITKNTPPIPVGGSVDLIFEIPPGCFSSSGCSFTICPDSSNQINELNEGNNCVGGRCIG